MSNYDQTIKKLIEASPSWDKDGGGVRGRTVVPIIGGSSVSGGLPEYVPQQFNQQNNQSFRRSVKPFSDLSLGGVGGGGDSCVGLALYTKDNEVWIGAGAVGGELPTGLTYSEGKQVATSGSGEVYVELTINETTGELESVVIDEQSSTPSNTSTKFHYALGYYEYDGAIPEITNYSCGSVDYTICRNWFTSSPPYYQVTFYRAGI